MELKVGMYVITNDRMEIGKTKVSNTGNYDYLPEHLIEDIVTKEQFESMKYIVEK